MLSSLCPYCETPKVLICSGDRAGQSYWPIGAGILGKEAAREGSGTWGRKGEKVLRHQIDVLTLHAISKRQRQWRRLSLQPLYFPGPDCTSLPEIVSSFISGTPNDSASATGLAAKADKARTRPGAPTGCPEIPSQGVDAAPAPVPLQPIAPSYRPTSLLVCKLTARFSALVVYALRCCRKTEFLNWILRKRISLCEGLALIAARS